MKAFTEIHFRRFARFLLFAIFFSSRPSVFPETHPVEAHPFGAEPGFVVIAGAEGKGAWGPAFALRMAEGGRNLVHVLLKDEKLVNEWRDRFAKAGFGGVILAEALPADGRLPYPDRFVNALWADETVSPEEARRVLATRGRVHHLGPGEGEAVRPDVASIDSWSHRFYDATGNCVSRDKVAALPEAIQWQHGPALEDGTADGKVPRIADGRFLATDNLTGDLVCRDAGNGFLLWRFPARLPDRSDFAVVGGKVYFHHEPLAPGAKDERRHLGRGPLVEVDLRTGSLLRTFSGGLRAGTASSVTFRRPQEDRERKETPYPWFVVSQKYVVQAYGSDLVLLDRESGKRLWSKKLTYERTWFTPVIAEREKLLFAAECRHPARRGRHDGTSDVHALVAFSLADGEERWRNEDCHPLREIEEKGRRYLAKPELKPLSYANGHLLVHLSSYQFRHGGGIALLDARSGKQRWSETFLPKQLYTQGSQRAVVRGDEVVVLDGTGAHRRRLATGESIGEPHHHPKVKRAYRTNGACTASRATLDWLFCGATLFVGPDWEVRLRKGTRGACGQGLTPANGMLYALPTPCDCGDYTRGYQGFAPRLAGPTVHKEARLARGPAFGETAPPKSAESAATSGDWPTFLARPARTSLASSPPPATLDKLWEAKPATSNPSKPGTHLERDRRQSERFLGPLSPPVVAHGLVLAALPEEHAVIALDVATGQTRWRHDAGGKVDSPPTLVAGLAVFGCDDGRVRALDLRSGSLVWKRLIAPTRTKAMLHGHLGSAHPLPGATLVLGDKVIVAAGVHSDVSGLHFHVLDLATGASLAHRVLGADHSTPVTNGLLAADDDGKTFWLGRRIRLDLDLRDAEITHEDAPPIFFDRNGDRIRFRSNDRRGGSTHGWKGAMQSGWARAHRIARSQDGVAYALKDPTSGDRHKVRAGQTALLTAAYGSWRERKARWTATATDLDAAGRESYSALLTTGERLYLGGGSRDGATGFLQEVDARSGKLLRSLPLPARVVECGLAVARRKLFVSLENGQLLCFGK